MNDHFAKPSLGVWLAIAIGGCSGADAGDDLAILSQGALDGAPVYLGSVEVPTYDGGVLMAHWYGCDSRAFATLSDTVDAALADSALMLQHEPCNPTEDAAYGEYEVNELAATAPELEPLGVPPGAPLWWQQGRTPPRPILGGASISAAISSVAVPLGIAAGFGLGLTLVIDRGINGNWAWQMGGRETLPQALGFTQDLSTIPLPFRSTVSCAFVNTPALPALDFECQSAQGHLDSGYRWPFSWSVYTCADIWNGSGSSTEWQNALAFCNAQAAACVYATNAACGRATNPLNMTTDLRTADLTLVK